jgi:hypothetical protein
VEKKVPKRGKAGKVDVPATYRDIFTDQVFDMFDALGESPFDPNVCTPQTVFAIEEQAWRPGTVDKFGRTLARMNRALNFARDAGDDAFIAKADRLARSYLKQRGQDIADERPEAARHLRELFCILREHFNFNNPEYAGPLAAYFMLWVVRSPDEWSDTIRARIWSDPGAAMESIKEALKKLMGRTRPVDEEDAIRHALIAVGYPEDQARNFFCRLD